MEFIYFDVGGVLIEDFSGTKKWDQLIMDWGISKEQNNKISEMFIDFQKEADIGRNVEDFLLIMKKSFGIKFSKNYSLLTDFVDRFYKNGGINKIFEKFENKYQLGLLTNMYPGMLEMIKDKNLIPDINWKVIVDSSIERCSKPEERIYKIAQDRSKTKASEILFIDNREENLRIPKNLGWQTFWFKSTDYEQSNKELEEFLG